MTGQQLKNSILQLAIQGKLVPQIESEGTAEDLLKEIRAEKEKLVKEGKLKKKDLEVKPIEDDEIPFEIPEGWKWVRGYDIFAPMQSTKPQGETFKYIDIDAIDNKKNEHIVKTINVANAPSRATRKIQKGDILFSTVRPYLRNVAIVKEDDCIASSGFFVCHPYSIDIEYCFRMLLSSYVIDGLTNNYMKGDNSPSINNDDLLNYLFPLPPLAEQKRIVAKIEELMPLVEEYGKAQERLETLNRELPDKLKKSVLQEAIMGKLVPQDPTEGTAEELLAEIRKEKEKLVKEGKLKKKDLEVKPIEDDEIPFEIPEGWRWCRLGEISTYALSKKKIKASEADPQMWGLDLEDIEKGGHLLCVKTVGERASIGDKTIFSGGDILYSKLRPYLLKILVAHQNGICTSEIVPFSCYGNIVNSYIVNFLKSPYVDEFINSTTFGIKMPRVSTETMISLLVPLPPHDEQKRIVEKVEEVMEMIEGMKI
ncbi:MAG: restriction endonuclease subunit S [Paludibacteraceae bacterium]|nr:restriction endonuclease subunit S [Paludibacteraceae bacterium]